MREDEKEKQYEAIDAYIAAMIEPQQNFRPAPLEPAYLRKRV
jgi:hypothetical protein